MRLNRWLGRCPDSASAGSVVGRFQICSRVSHPVFLTRGVPDFPRGIGVHRRNAEPNDQIGPSGKCIGRNPAAMMATFARTSFRADRNAARVRLPLCARNCTSINAHDRLMTRAPPPANDKGSGAGGIGTKNFSHAVHNVARPGIDRMPARDPHEPGWLHSSRARWRSGN